MAVINPALYGVSFSIKQCRSFQIDPVETLDWLINEAGFRRFRLMSYWNECESTRGKLDFTELDRQIAVIEKSGGIISLCLGARQPRWPENHWPEWAWQLSKFERSAALLAFIETVVNRYKSHDCIVSYQLENEALLKQFGERAEVDRLRLRNEYELVKQLDSSKPLIMTTSNAWGIPVRRPIPDLVGFSYYTTQYRQGAYHHSSLPPWVQQLRILAIRALHRAPVFIHELQLEPWGPKAIWEMDMAEQDKSMNPTQIARNIELARSIHATPIDLWGGEWWYWRLKTHDDPTIWHAVKQQLQD